MELLESRMGFFTTGVVTACNAPSWQSQETDLVLHGQSVEKLKDQAESSHTISQSMWCACWSVAPVIWIGSDVLNIFRYSDYKESPIDIEQYKVGWRLGHSVRNIEFRSFYREVADGDRNVVDWSRGVSLTCQSSKVLKLPSDVEMTRHSFEDCLRRPAIPLACQLAQEWRMKCEGAISHCHQVGFKSQRWRQSAFFSFLLNFLPSVFDCFSFCLYSWV